MNLIPQQVIETLTRRTRTGLRQTIVACHLPSKLQTPSMNGDVGTVALSRLCFAAALRDVQMSYRRLKPSDTACARLEGGKREVNKIMLNTKAKE